jgi:hypothetical protein
MALIVELWEKHLEPILVPLWDSLLVWRTLALVLVSLAGAAFVYRDKVLHLLQRHKYLEHDRGVFGRGDGILPEEFVYDTLDILESDHSSTSESFRQMVDFERFYDLEANRFLDPRLDSAAKRLSDAIGQLTHFIAYNFFPFPSGSNRTCMYPALNIDREGDGSPEEKTKYDKYTSELLQLTVAVRAGYRTYRSAVKKRLLQ